MRTPCDSSRLQTDSCNRFSIDATQPNWAGAYEFDIHLRGADAVVLAKLVKEANIKIE